MANVNESVQLWYRPVVVSLILTACSGIRPTEDPVSPGAGGRTESNSMAEDAAPGVEGTVHAAFFLGTLQAVDPGRRQATVMLDDGKLLVRVDVGKDAGDLSALKPGSRISFTLRESVRFTQGRFFHPETGRVVNRFPPKSMSERELTSSYFTRSPTGHHDMHWSRTIDVPAKVVSVDPRSRMVQLITYDGRNFSVTVSNPRVNLGNLSEGEPVVAHFKEIDTLDVIR
jgi:hypothetical protein